MDKKATIDELKKEVSKFINDRDWGVRHKAKDVCMDIASEAGELCQIFRYKTDDECLELFKNPVRRDHIEEEIADVFYGVLDFASIHGIDLSTALRNKIEKNNKKYPVETCKGDYRKYNEK